MPPAQVKFVEIVSSAQNQVKAASNDMQIGGIKAERDKALCQLISSPVVTNWVGTIKKVDANSDGKGVLAISIAPDVDVNSLSDIGDDTLINPSSNLFAEASNMAKGQTVTFSGKFFKDRQDCLKESSLSLKGKVSEPEFIFKFSKVSLAK